MVWLGRGEVSSGGSLQGPSSHSHRIYLVAGDPQKYKEVNFLVDNRSYRTYFGSDAVRRYLMEEGKGVKLTILVPESLLVDKTLEDFEEELKHKVDDFETFTIPAIGVFGEKRYKRFEGAIENVVTAIFLKLLEDRPDKLLADITTGFNLYPVSLVEAVRRYLTYRKLSNILQGKIDVEASTIFYPVHGVEAPRIEIQPLDAKAFFSIPRINNKNLTKSLKGRPEVFRRRLEEISKKYADVRAAFERLYNELKVAFNAIRFNVPLAFYEILQMREDADVLEEGVKAFVKELLEPVENTEESLKRLEVDGVGVANVFYSLALYRSIKTFAKNLESVDLNEIYEKFKDLYGKQELGLGLYYYFLDKDVRNIMEAVNRAIKNGKIKEGEEKPLIELKEFMDNVDSHEKRNFFAHSGFIWNYTLVRKNGVRINVRWREDKKEEIRSWLEKPEK